MNLTNFGSLELYHQESWCEEIAWLDNFDSNITESSTLWFQCHATSNRAEDSTTGCNTIMSLFRDLVNTWDMQVY